MKTSSSQLEALLDLDSRHDELLQRLDELDKRVEQVLAECLATREKEERPHAEPPAD